MSNKAPYPVIILCLIVLLPFLEAAPPKEEAPPPISYREVPKYLTTSQIYQWETALEQRQLGQSQVASGNRLINREPTPLRSAENIKKDKEDGKALVTRGEALIAAAEAELLQLQKIAYANQQKAAPVEIEPTTYSLELAALRREPKPCSSTFGAKDTHASILGEHSFTRQTMRCRFFS